MGNSASHKSPREEGSSPASRLGLTRLLTAALLALSLVSTIIFLVLAADALFGIMNNLGKHGLAVLEALAPQLPAIFVIMASLIAGVAALGSQIFGLHHVWVWTTLSGNAAQAVAWVAFGLLLLPFMLVFEGIHLGGFVGGQTKATVAFVVIGTLAHLAYTLLLYASIN